MGSTGQINSRWLNLHPTRRFDAGYWTTVLNKLTEMGIDPPGGASDEQVKAAMIAVDQEADKHVSDARQLRNRARELEEEARNIEARAKPVKGERLNLK